MSVHPGGIRTDIVRRARFRKQNGSLLGADDFAEMFDEVARTIPDAAARRIVRGIKRGKERLRVGSDAVTIDWARRLFPLGAVKLAGMIYDGIFRRRERAKSGSDQRPAAGGLRRSGLP